MRPRSPTMAPVHVFVCFTEEGRLSRVDQLAAFRLDYGIGPRDPIHEVIVTFSDDGAGARQ